MHRRTPIAAACIILIALACDAIANDRTSSGGSVIPCTVAISVTTAFSL